MQVSSTPKGLTFTRALIAKAQTKSISGNLNPEAIAAFATNRWGAYQADEITKSMVLTTGDTGNTAATEFFGLVREKSILGRLSGLRQVKFYTQVLALTEGAKGYWVGEGQETPLSLPVLQGNSLKRTRVASIVVQTNEALQAAGKVAESGIQNELLRAVSASIDTAFLVSDNDGIPDIKPASITNNIPITPSTGDIHADVAALIETFAGDLTTAFFISDPVTAVRLAGTFEDVGVRGGEMLGIPLLTTRAQPRDSNGGHLILVDPTAIAFGFDGGTVDLSEHATLNVQAGTEDDPELLSLWQNNLTAFKVEVHINWKVEVAGSVSVLAVA